LKSRIKPKRTRVHPPYKKWWQAEKTRADEFVALYESQVAYTNDLERARHALQQELLKLEVPGKREEQS
jgi:hypothetical protein